MPPTYSLLRTSACTGKTDTQIARLLTQGVLHRPGQDVHRGPGVAGLAHFRLQQHVFAQPRLIEAPAIGARLLLGPVLVCGAGRRAVERPDLSTAVVQVERCRLPRTAHRSI